MTSIILAAVIFGLVHPGSKLILDTGINLVSFCELYVLIRLIVQIPFVIKNQAWKISSAMQLQLLLAVGIVGASLQLMEFMGISKGLPVPVVTFLVYSHPVWSLLFSRFINNEFFSQDSLLKLGCGLIGIALITGSQVSMFGPKDIIKLIAPLSAGLLIALWVSLSNKLKKTNETSSWTISFYYDLFALVALLGIGQLTSSHGLAFSQICHWLSTGMNFPKIFLYSVLGWPHSKSTLLQGKLHSPGFYLKSGFTSRTRGCMLCCKSHLA